MKIQRKQISLNKPLTEIIYNLHRTTRRFKRNCQSDPHELFLEIVNSFPVDLKRIFFGKLKSTITCARGHINSVDEDFLNLSLDIPYMMRSRRKTNSIYLRNLLKNFINKHDNIIGYKCSSCHNRECKAQRKYSFKVLPEVLAVHFKLFDSMARKKNVKVGFKEIIEIKGLKYEAVSLIEHRGGGIHYGHYVSYCRRSDGIWVLLNDSRVSTVSKREIVSKIKPYMIFYKKIRKHQPQSIPEPIILPNDIIMNGEDSSNYINKNIEDIFAKAIKKEEEVVEEKPNQIIIEEQDKPGDSLQELNEVKETKEYINYMNKFSALNKKILDKKNNLTTDKFYYNGKEFNTKDLQENKRIIIFKNRKHFIKLGTKYNRLSKMRRVVSILKSIPVNKNIQTGGSHIHSIKSDVLSYLQKVELENSKDLLTFQARKRSDDLEYDKGKTKKIRKKNKRKRKKLNFQKAYLKKTKLK